MFKNTSIYKFKILNRMLALLCFLLYKWGCVIISDRDHYLINRKLLDSIFNILPVFIGKLKGTQDFLFVRFPTQCMMYLGSLSRCASPSYSENPFKEALAEWLSLFQNEVLSKCRFWKITLRKCSFFIRIAAYNYGEIISFYKQLKKLFIPK
jgi:hypothetical protein